MYNATLGWPCRSRIPTIRTAIWKCAATSRASSPIQRRASFGVSPTATAATNLPPTPRPGARLPPTPRTGWSSWGARPGSASIHTASTPKTTPNIALDRCGVFTWDPGSSFLDLGLAVTPEQAQEIERLGYGTLWVTGSPAAELSFAEPLLESTTALKVATGIVNIWTANAKTVAESFHRINTAHPGRFVLGIGAGHPEHTEQYRKPYDALVDYLDELDEYGLPANQCVLAVLGLRVLRLAAERTAGAHPYNTTPEHSAQAREIIGPNALLLPEHMVVLPIADAEEALAVGRKVLNTYNYLNLTNYVHNFQRLGFTDADLTPPGSDKFIDALVAYGTPDDVANRLGEHLRAGADHVVIQVIGGTDKLLPTLTDLASALGLTPRP